MTDLAITRRDVADEVDLIDEKIAELNTAKRDIYDAYREQLVPVIGKAQVPLELASLKAAIRMRRAKSKNEREFDERAGLTEEIFAEITGPEKRAARAPARAREIIEEFRPVALPPHDPTTGEIIDFQRDEAFSKPVTPTEGDGHEVGEQHAHAIFGTGATGEGLNAGPIDPVAAHTEHVPASAPPIDITIPTFLQIGHPDCNWRTAQ